MKRYLHFILKRQSTAYIVILVYLLIFLLSQIIGFSLAGKSVKITVFAVSQNLITNWLLMWCILFGIVSITPAITTLYSLGASRKRAVEANLINLSCHAAIPALLLPLVLILAPKKDAFPFYLMGMDWVHLNHISTLLLQVFLIFSFTLFVFQLIQYMILIFMHFKVLFGLSNIAFMMALLFFIIPLFPNLFIWGDYLLGFALGLLICNLIFVGVNAKLIYRLEINR